MFAILLCSVHFYFWETDYNFMFRIVLSQLSGFAVKYKSQHNKANKTSDRYRNNNKYCCNNLSELEGRLLTLDSIHVAQWFASSRKLTDTFVKLLQYKKVFCIPTSPVGMSIDLYFARNTFFTKFYQLCMIFAIFYTCLPKMLQCCHFAHDDHTNCPTAETIRFG